MIEVKLKPVYDKDSYSAGLAKQIEYAIWSFIYKPILDAADLSSRQASKASLIKALETGVITYQDPYFMGQFSASVSKDLRSLGAKWDKSKKAFRMEDVPPEVWSAILQGKNVTEDKIKEINLALDGIEGRKSQILGLIDVGSHFESTVKSLGDQFYFSLKTMKHDLAVPADMNPKMKEDLKRSYQENLDYYVEQYTDEAIYRLRKRVEDNVLKGFRAENLVADIRSESKRSEGKAKFLARQETSLMVSKFREIRFKDAGVERYKWSTSGDTRVRDDHKDLNGKIFSWDDPPIVEKSTGRRGNPGEDFNCRCVAIPLLRVQGEYK